jgi:hypothetical protein
VGAFSWCEGEDSNLHGSYPTATSRGGSSPNPQGISSLGGTQEYQGVPKDTVSGSVTQADLETLDGPASAMLEAARDGLPVSTDDARRMARACIERDDMGRTALAVLDGGAFAGSRLVELAQRILAKATDVSDSSGDTGT